ncbi:GrBNV gp28-like protein [Tomelloso virus]|uniref:GrBNV gp28-like protein n=1 Tax=Tomelloso virus TaxID=2053981 RepID=A0A2H4T2S5_9VIRU|nr:GrBNV gp28-like protein [Tomelloso virus]ATY70180.1 GrBNV gp28-like protein [Tomelloso virus]
MSTPEFYSMIVDQAVNEAEACIDIQWEISNPTPPPDQAPELYEVLEQYMAETIQQPVETPPIVRGGGKMINIADSPAANKSDSEDSDDESDSSSGSGSSSESEDSSDDEEIDEELESLVSINDGAQPVVRTNPVRTNEAKTISHVLLKTNIDSVKKDPKYIVPKGDLTVKKYIHKYPTPPKNARVFEMCNVIFDDIPPESDSTMVYDKALQLVSLHEFVSINQSSLKGLFIQDKLFETPHGRALRRLSTAHSIRTCQHRRLLVNNATLTPKIYNLVYGAVPNLMAYEYASYILLKKYRFKQSEKSSAPLIADGELEIGAYCYTLLASTDLLKWANDKDRKELKAYLVYACSFITEEELRFKVLSIVDIKEKKYITAESMLLIKQEYAAIISSLRRITDVSVKEKAIGLWHCFMHKCDLHHYLCPHTLRKVATFIKIVGKKLITKVELLDLENSDHDLTGLKYTFDETKMMFNFIPHVGTATIESIRQVQKSLSTVYNHFLQMFASHLVDFGIYPTTHKINVHHVDGFAKLQVKLMSPNNNNVKIPIMENKFGVINSTIAKMVQSIRTEFDIDRPIAMDREAISALMYTINMIILKRVELLMYMEDHDVCLGRAINDELRALFETDEFNSVDNINAWSRINDDEVEIGDLSEQSDADDDSDLEEETIIIGDDEHHQLLVDLTKTYVAPEPIVKRRPVPNTKIAQVTNRNYKRVTDITPYMLLDENIPRTACTMCKRRRTLKAMKMRTDIVVSCCKTCHTNLVIDFMAENKTVDFDTLVRRVENNYAIPLAFDANDEFIPDSLFDKTQSRLICNRLLREEKQPSKRKRNAPTANNNTKRSKIAV